MRNEVVELYLDDIIPNRFQPREKFDDEALRELSASIKEHGVIQPIIVRQIGEKYEIIAGERRYKASALAGLTKIPAIIRNLDDKEASKVALLENLQRKDLTAIEEARTYQKILELDSMTQEELGRTMGKSQAAIANKLRLLSLTDEVQEALLNDQISERHARSLLNITNGNEQIEMLHRVISQRMTVRELDNEIKKLNLSKQVTLPLEETENPVNTIETASSVPFEIKEERPIVIEEKEEVTNRVDPFTEATPNTNNGAPMPFSIEGEEKTFSNQAPIEQPIESLFDQPMESHNESMNQEEPRNSFLPNFDTLEEPAPVVNSPVSSEIPEYKPVTPDVPQTTPIDTNFIEGFKYQDAVNLVKNLIPEIQNKGVHANIQEFDLDNKYQIIINIDKNEY